MVSVGLSLRLLLGVSLILCPQSQRMYDSRKFHLLQIPQ